MKAYKGFNSDLTCKPKGVKFQYEEGKEYEMETAECCDHGFHACEYPLECLRYYEPSSSVYHEVELDGEISRNDENGTKVAATKIKIGASINIAGLVKAAIEYTTKRIDNTKKSTGYCGASSATGYCGASSATGDFSASTATGYCGASTATGYCGASSATGDFSASTATGYCGASSATGDFSASTATGYCGASTATGDHGASSATGDHGASTATGYCGASTAENKDAIAVAWGNKGKARGVKGAHLVLAEWNLDSSLREARMVRVDGETIRENTWYTLEQGELKETN